MIFLGDKDRSWLYQDNDYKPVKEAIQFLIDGKVGKRFNGALQVMADELPTFVNHLYWLIRCNAALPYIHFSDPGQNFMGSICKYGSFHLDVLNERTDALMKCSLTKTAFRYLDGNSCNNQSGMTTAIPGRQTRG